jgi:hypothetical protein
VFYTSSSLSFLVQSIRGASYNLISDRIYRVEAGRLDIVYKFAKSLKVFPVPVTVSRVEDDFCCKIHFLNDP